jgi:CheY-like chemotaxis protein
MLDLPKEIVESLCGKRFALVGFFDGTTQIVQLLDDFQIFSRSFDWVEAEPGARNLRPFDLVVINLHTVPDKSFWLNPIALQQNTKPLLFIGSLETLSKLMPNVPGIKDFILVPCQPSELLLRAYNILSAFTNYDIPKDDLLKNGPHTVVVADDDRTITKMVEVVLKRLGMKAEIVNDGGQALEVVKKILPDAAILDVKMPHMDGFEVLAEVKNNPSTKNMPIIMLTSCQQEIDVIKGFELGADDYVVKPFNPIELAVRLKRLLNRASAR